MEITPKVSPLVSCIIPTKNRPELVMRAIRSALEQSYSKIEVIVIDDSTDMHTQHLLSKSGLCIKYIKNVNSKGACYSRNIGLMESKGDYIAFLDDDDLWMPRKIEKQLRLANTYPIVGCNSTTIIRGKRHYTRRPAIVTYENLLYNNNCLGSCSFVMTASDAIQGCFFDENLKAGQDWDMWISIMKKNKISEAANADEYLADYNSGEHSRISNTAEATQAILYIYEKHLKEHTALSTRMFSLYNLLPTDGSLTLWIFREFLKSRMRGKGVVFFMKNLIEKSLRRTEVY